MEISTKNERKRIYLSFFVEMRFPEQGEIDFALSKPLEKPTKMGARAQFGARGVTKASIRAISHPLAGKRVQTRR